MTDDAIDPPPTDRTWADVLPCARTRCVYDTPGVCAIRTAAAAALPMLELVPPHSAIAVRVDGHCDAFVAPPPPAPAYTRADNARDVLMIVVICAVFAAIGYVTYAVVNDLPWFPG